MGSRMDSVLLGQIPLGIQEIPDLKEGNYILGEVHEGNCGNHSGGGSLALKVLRQGYYWPTMKEDAFKQGGVKYAVVDVNYFIKWAEAMSLATITAKKIKDFIFNSIVCRFGIPYKLISDNGKQFDSKELRKLCEDLNIKKDFVVVYHPESNGQTEAINKIIKHTLNTKLEEKKGD
ncbi:uncharacterized protein LOC141696292 [Apium graveolens]|uniref:uncharacterized protein LOC141696292 n=1 Tax=Apium graveolens TaxID=4045 RepID=UPI003D7A8B56